MSDTQQLASTPPRPDTDVPVAQAGTAATTAQAASAAQQPARTAEPVAQAGEGRPVLTQPAPPSDDPQQDAAASRPSGPGAEPAQSTPPAKPSWHRRRWVRITALALVAVIALGGAFGAGILVGRGLASAGAPAAVTEGELPQGGPGGMTPPGGGTGGFGQAPGTTDDETTDDGTTTEDGTGGFGA